MRISRILTAVVAVSFGVVALAATLPGPSGRDGTAPDLNAVAHRLVTQAAGVVEGDRVVITGDVKEMALLENLAVQARAQGAHPILLVETPQLVRRYYTEVPEAFDAAPNPMALLLAQHATVWLSVEGEPSSGLLADIPLERRRARARANEEFARTVRERCIRTVNIGNEFYPTDARAKDLGVTRDEMTAMFWNGVGSDPARIGAVGEAVSRMVGGGGVLRLTHPNGTDLRMSLAARPARVSDGAVSPADVKAGNCTVWLPAGEAMIMPVPGTADGNLVIPWSEVDGQKIRDLRLTIKGGRITEMTAAEGLEPLRKMYALAGEGADRFGVVDIGLNPDVRRADGSALTAWMSAGMVTVGFGGDVWAGGDNAVAFGHYGQMPGATVTVDGEAIVENGRLKVGAM